MNEVLVIVPTYKERDNIEKLVNTLFSLGKGLDVLIVDDGSDGTDELIREMQRGNSRLYLIKREGKGGRGSAVNEGLQWGLKKNYDYLVEMDADISHDPEELPKLLERAAPDTVVIGSRYARGSQIISWPLKRRVFSKLANVYASLVLGLGIHDYTNGFRVYPRALIARMDFEKTRSRGFIALSEIAYELAGLGAKFVEVPIRFVNRKRGASSFSLKEIKESFLSVLKIKFSVLEIVALGLLALSFFIGLTHGFPLTRVIGDEAPNVGGVLRALEAKTLLPAVGDVPYATVTYLLSYFFIVVYLLLAFPLFGFNMAALKLHFLENPHELYFVVRLGSALLAIATIVLLERMARKSGAARGERLSIILLVMTNLLIASHFRTTKVWVLSTFLVLLSIYYLYRAQKASAPQSRRAAIVRAIFFACLSLANFPLNLYSVAAVLLLVFVFFRKEEGFYQTVFWGLFWGGLAIGAVSALNWQNILDQAQTMLVEAGAGSQFSLVPKILLNNLQRILLLFPLLLIPVLFVRRIRDQKLFTIALVCLFLYLGAISFTATWISGTAIFLRYLIPFGLFLGLLLMSLEFRPRFVLPVLAGLSVVYYLFLVVYLSRPTTYNLVNDWTYKNLNSEQTVIISDAQWLELPLNKKSAQYLQNRYCGTLCRETIRGDLKAEFKPLVFDARRSEMEVYKNLLKNPAGMEFYLYTDTERPEFSDRLVVAVGQLSTKEYFGVDHRLGTYFDPRYFTAKNFGERIYVYRFQ